MDRVGRLKIQAVLAEAKEGRRPALLPAKSDIGATLKRITALNLLVTPPAVTNGCLHYILKIPRDLSASKLRTVHRRGRPWRKLSFSTSFLPPLSPLSSSAQQYAVSSITAYYQQTGSIRCITYHCVLSTNSAIRPGVLAFWFSRFDIIDSRRVKLPKAEEEFAVLPGAIACHPNPSLLISVSRINVKQGVENTDMNLRKNVLHQ